MYTIFYWELVQKIAMDSLGLGCFGPCWAHTTGGRRAGEQGNGFAPGGVQRFQGVYELGTCHAKSWRFEDVYFVD